jgi:DNA-binding winged helix-turn-helix (wHTH) protein
MALILRSDPENRAEIYIVADLRVDVGRQCVFRGHSDIALPNLSFRLLVALIRLMELVWPGQVVSPETVNKRVKLLRDVLGDDVREPRYIAGVRSRGYRLIAPVQTAPPAENASAAAQVDSHDAAESLESQPEMPLQPAAQTVFGNRRWLSWSAAALTMVAAAALAVRWGMGVFEGPGICASRQSL